jgi:hypothetical protein
MMLRIIFTGLATCVLLLAAGVRFAREDAPQDVRQALGSALERAIKSAKQALPRLQQPRPAAQTRLEPAAQAPAPVPSAAASPAPPPPASRPMPPPAQAGARTHAGEAETVTEESISPLWSAPFVESPKTELGSAGEENPGLQAPVAAPSQDEWAGLIRRMLAIYQRVGMAE